MNYMPLETLLKEGNSLYKLVLLSAKRGLQVSQGAPPLVPTTSNTQPGTVALEEIRTGQVSYRLTDAPKETKKKREKSG